RRPVKPREAKQRATSILQLFGGKVLRRGEPAQATPGERDLLVRELQRFDPAVVDRVQREHYRDGARLDIDTFVADCESAVLTQVAVQRRSSMATTYRRLNPCLAREREDAAVILRHWRIQWNDPRGPKHKR